ncbi:MAG: prolipoprotein diacylglyceryl transferase [Gammaproteobacteria bacterium]|nr:prolipoprotein diacylglyceryl transferase [Gammaproteobacteria bacterium]
MPIGLGAGRLGNFINGELWGGPTDLPWAVIVDGVPRHPSQLYEARWRGCCCSSCCGCSPVASARRWRVSGLFLLVYGVFRFRVEFWRLPDVQIGYLALGWFTMGQVLTLPMLVAGAILLSRRPTVVRQYLANWRSCGTSST